MELRDKKLLLISYFLFLIFIVACGRRGDPVAIVPHNKTGVERDLDKGAKEAEDLNVVSTGRDRDNMGEIRGIPPELPRGLMAVYTQKSIVLTWDEVIGQSIKLYRIYRSTGEDYILVGDTVTTAFTDKDIEPEVKYYYRITAVGESEGPPSKEIEIVTEVH